ncbi:unnamed protein product [Musa hybrid cultivar]
MKEPSVLAQLIQSYARARKLNRGKQLHAHLISLGGVPSTFVANHLINMYAKCGDIHHAAALFDGMTQRNLVSWSAMISGFSQNGQALEALRTFSLMCGAGVRPTEFAFSSAIQASASFGSLAYGRQMHCSSVKLGFDDELFVGSNLAEMYAGCGSLIEARLVFEEMPWKDEVSWTTMIDGYAKNGNFEDALRAFKEMIDAGRITIDQHALCSALNACAGLKAYRFGQSLHSSVVKLGLESETFIVNALTDMYAKAGDMDSASSVSKKVGSDWNVVSCSSLIDGYVEMNQFEEALRTYVDCRRHGTEPNEFTFSSMVKACANQAVLEQGTQFHAQVIKTSFDIDPYVSSSLVDMYGKCGILKCSIQLFGEIQHASDAAWNSMVGALAHHGRGKEAVEAFHRMVAGGCKPNHISFVNLLMACSHSGLVESGLEYFHSMHKTYGVEPAEEHYSCVIDMLARAGRLEEVKDFIGRMPFEPNAYGWCSLLGACRTHGDVELGEFAAEKLMKLEPGNTGIHVLLSTMYASMGHWEDVKAARKLMRDSRVKKLPGFSWVDVDNKAHVFGADDPSHPQIKEIHEKLEELSVKLSQAGYVPVTASVASNLEEGSRGRSLHHHSERIAVAFALISTPPTKPIIVKKNLRICMDCHSAIKLISQIESREIIVRDNARFHHFADGMCSCGDYCYDGLFSDGKTFKKPRRPYEKERLDAELKLVGEYGLRCKRELWRVQYALSRIRNAARDLLTLDEKNPRRIFEGEALLRRMNRYGLLEEGQNKLDYVLALTVENFLERRLQTLVFKSGMAKSIHHARVLIRQRHIRVGRQVVNIPSFMVRVDSAKHIDFSLTSPFGGGRPGRVKRRNQKAAAKKAAGGDGDEEDEE